MSAIKLFEGQSANASSDWQTAKGGDALVFVWGTFGGGAVKIELSPDASTAFEDTDLTFTAQGMQKFYIPASTQFRATLSGSSGASINCSVIG